MTVGSWPRSSVERLIDRPLAEVKDTTYVQVAPQVLSLHLNNREDTMHRDDIGTITVEQGQVMVALNGAKAGCLGVGSHGVFKFLYARLSNARRFFALLGQGFAEDNVAGGINNAPAFAIAQGINGRGRQAGAIHKAGADNSSAGDEK